MQQSKECFECASGDRVWGSKHHFTLRLHRKMSTESKLIKRIQIDKRSATGARFTGPRR